MARDHLGPDADRLLVARLNGIATRHARWHESTEPETAATVEELRGIAADRPDLLAEVAGILLGFHEGHLNEARMRAAATFCIAAGADPDLIPRWVAEGQRRTAIARKPPFSNPGQHAPWRP